MTIITRRLMLSAFLIGSACSRVQHQATPGPTKGVVQLFNGRDLDGWDVYLGAGKDAAGPAVNDDPLGVFSVVEVDGAPAIRVSGQRWGALTTRGEFENYRLKLEFKWGQKRWPPRENGVRDSGILYHAVLPVQRGNGWMRSFECQIEEHDTGDFWAVNGAIVDVEVGPMDDTDAKRTEFAAWLERNGGPRTPIAHVPGGRRVTLTKEGLMKSRDADRPTGAWNVVEVVCTGDTCIHVVNGKENMRLLNLRQRVDGHDVPLRRGKIQLQSEGAEIYFRNIEIHR